MSVLEKLGKILAVYLSKPSKRVANLANAPEHVLINTLKPGDILLVEGSSRISLGIQYVTQSCWTHAALYLGLYSINGVTEPALIEADVVEGVRIVPVSIYGNHHTRICRAKNITKTDIENIIQCAMSNLGNQYDLKNIFDLLRYTISNPPVPRRWRHKLLAFASGAPTKAICSTLIAQAFQSIRYPILPHITRIDHNNPYCIKQQQEILHTRHYLLFTPRDFDLSPYFAIIKPTLEHDFDHHKLTWSNLVVE